MRCGAFHRVEGTLCLVRHGQAALSGSKTKAPGFAGGYLLNLCSEDVCLHEKPDQLLYVSASVSVFWLASSSVLADRRARHPQSRLVLLAVLVSSLDQRLVGQPLASNAVHEAVEARQGVVLDIAFVQP